MTVKTTHAVDRWIPNYAIHGYSLAQATEIARRCETKQSEQPNREWTEILAEVVASYDTAGTDQVDAEDYPQVWAWLRQMDARCQWRLPIGPKNNPSACAEGWIANGRFFIVVAYSHGQGWDIFTSGNTIRAESTLEDATKRIQTSG